SRPNALVPRASDTRSLLLTIVKPRPRVPTIHNGRRVAVCQAPWVWCGGPDQECGLILNGTEPTHTPRSPMNRAPFIALILAPLAMTPARADEAARVYRGATVLTVTKGEIADADLVVKDGKIAEVGKRGEVKVPEGAEVIDLKGMLVIPGLVDTHSHI